MFYTNNKHTHYTHSHVHVCVYIYTTHTVSRDKNDKNTFLL